MAGLLTAPITWRTDSVFLLGLHWETEKSWNKIMTIFHQDLLSCQLAFFQPLKLGEMGGQIWSHFCILAIYLFTSKESSTYLLSEVVYKQ